MNQDYLALKPNQRVDNDQTECTALTVSSLVGNRIGKPCDPDYSYASTLKVMGMQPNTSGADPLCAMYSAILYGCLPVSSETFTALSTSELYVANYQNYTKAQVQFSQTTAQKGVTALDGYAEITAWLNLNKGGVGLPIRWYESFNTPNADGTLPAPSGAYSEHMVAAYDFDSRGIMVNPWLGAAFGQNGYVWIPPATLPLIQQDYTYSFAFNPQGWRWLSVAQIAVLHPTTIPDALPILSLLT